jgi:hypothetical protein
LEELIRKFTDDPFAEEPGYQIGISRLLEARRQHDTWERLAQMAVVQMLEIGARKRSGA